MIDTLPFGRSGHQSSRIIFGGAALSEVSADEADRALGHLLDYGVNHIDTSVTYGDSEKHIGRWMKEHRSEFFLATKIDARTYPEARRELERSLHDLGTDQVDLLQMHELVTQQEVETFLSDNGAVHVLHEAKEKGLAGSIGVTSHGWNAPDFHLHMLDVFDYDSVLLPFNFVLSTMEEYRPQFDRLREVCRHRNIAMQTIKSIARGPWEKAPKTRSTWYRPLEEQADIDRAVHWVLGFPELFLCSTGDLGLMPKVLDAADRFQQPPSREDMEEMRRRLGMTIMARNHWPRLWD
jgi:aryl-alcohol dehydrogenase-like predicted oxidoreductase